MSEVVKYQKVRQEGSSVKSMSGVEQQPGVVPGLVPGEDLHPPAGGFLQTLEKVQELSGQSFVFQRLS